MLTYLPKLEYDGNFGALVRKKAKYPLDGVPLAVGLACLLKQFHPSYTRTLLAYMGQFIRSELQHVFSDAEGGSSGGGGGSGNNKGAQEVPREVLNMLVFLDQLCHYSSVPRSAVHEYVPPYIFDALRFTAAPPSKKH